MSRSSKKNSEVDAQLNIGRLNIPISLPETKLNLPLPNKSGRKLSKGGNISENASTNASKSRTNSTNKRSFIKQDSAKKSVNISQVGTHSDNFLSSLVSIRETDKKKKKTKKFKKLDLPINDSWLKKLNDLSFDTDLSEGECLSIVKNLLPEFSEASKNSSKVTEIRESLEEISINPIFNQGKGNTLNSEVCESLQTEARKGIENKENEV
jgi:hypothetical protein